MIRGAEIENSVLGMPVKKFFDGHGAIEPSKAFTRGVVVGETDQKCRVLWEFGEIEIYSKKSLIAYLANECLNHKNENFFRFLKTVFPD